MTRPDRPDRPDATPLRLPVPEIPADPVFVERLAALAAASRPTPAAVAVRSLPRVIAAAAAVAAIAGGGAYAASRVGDPAPSTIVPTGQQTDSESPHEDSTDDSTDEAPAPSDPVGTTTSNPNAYDPGAANGSGAGDPGADAGDPYGGLDHHGDQPDQTTDSWDGNHFPSDDPSGYPDHSTDNTDHWGSGGGDYPTAPDQGGSSGPSDPETWGTRDPRTSEDVGVPGR